MNHLRTIVGRVHRPHPVSYRLCKFRFVTPIQTVNKKWGSQSYSTLTLEGSIGILIQIYGTPA